MIDIKAVIPLFIKVLCPPSYKLLLCILRLSRDLYHGLAKELDHAIFKCLLAGVPCPNREKTFDEWLQVSCFRAPDIGRFSFYFVDWIIAPRPPSANVRSPILTASKKVVAADVARAAWHIMAQIFGS